MSVKPAPRVTHGQVVSVVGHLDDENIGRIIDSGATAQEVAEAFTWFNAEEAIAPNPQHQMTAPVARVYEILLAAEAGDDDRER